MNFFEHQRAARRNTVIMFFSFLIAHMMTITLLIAVPYYFVMGFARGKDLPVVILSFLQLVTSPIFLSIFAGYSLYILLSIYLKWQEMEHPDRHFANMTKARRIFRDKTPQDFFDQRLLNTAEEMSIAAGIPMPRLYVIPDDPSLNAFAVGWNHLSSAIFITEGALRGFNRDEVQAVIGHELSHIINGDTRSGTMMVVMTEVLTGMSSFFGNRVEDMSRVGGGKHLNALLVLMFAISAVGSVFSRFISSAISRQKEYLADASSAQFTRNPHALASALKKIALLEDKSLSTSNFVPEGVAHMTFSSISGEGQMKSFFSEFFSFNSHPPTLRRIQRLLPGTSDVFLSQVKKLLYTENRFFYDGFIEDKALGFAPAYLSSSSDLINFNSSEQEKTNDTLPEESGFIAKEELMFRIGTIPENSILLAQALEDTKPLRLLKKDLPLESFVLACMFPPDIFTQDHPNSLVEPITRSFGKMVLWGAKELATSLALLPSIASVSLLIQVLPRLQRLSEQERRELLISLNLLVSATSSCDIALIKKSAFMVIKFYLKHLEAPQQASFGIKGLILAQENVEKVLWFMSKHSSNSDAAFYKACRYLQYKGELRIPENMTWADFEKAILALDELSVSSKKNLLGGIMKVVATDTVVLADEIALLQAVCFALRCPFPPLMVETTPQVISNDFCAK